MEGKMLHRCRKMCLPDHSCIYVLANKFISFFINKSPSFALLSAFYFPIWCSCSRALNLPDTRKVWQNLTLPPMMRCVILFCWLRASHLTWILYRLAEMYQVLDTFLAAWMTKAIRTMSPVRRDRTSARKRSTSNMTPQWTPMLLLKMMTTIVQISSMRTPTRTSHCT